MLIMDSSSSNAQLPTLQVLMPSQPFANSSINMVQMPLVPQYCLGPGAPFPSYGYMTQARGPPAFHGQPSTASPPNGVAGHSSSSASSTSSSCSAAVGNPSINRSQRCGVCRGCQCKPCGLCTYCQDSPQFGGPGVKKQSCIERRCLRVLENRLQRDAPTFKARVGCNNCDDCRAPDCQICLVCLDKRFFNKYMCGALCAKKRCNNATSLELPSTQTQLANVDKNQQQQILKRSYENAHFEHMIAKRRGLEIQMHQQIQQQQQLQQQKPLDQLISPAKQLTVPPAATSAHQQAQLTKPSTSTPEDSPSASPNGSSSPSGSIVPGKVIEEHQLGNPAGANIQFHTPTFNRSIYPQTICFEPIAGVDNAKTNVVPQSTSTTSMSSLVVGASSIGQSFQVVMGGMPAPCYTHLQPAPPVTFFSTTTPMATFQGGRQVVYQPHEPLPPLAIGGGQPAQQQQHQFQTYHQYQQRFLNYPKYEYYEEDNDSHHGAGAHIYDVNQPDPFVPPSYSELKNGVVLQPL